MSALMFGENQYVSHFNSLPHLPATRQSARGYSRVMRLMDIPACSRIP
jgi:hypothetical protein